MFQIANESDDLDEFIKDLASIIHSIRGSRDFDNTRLPDALDDVHCEAVGLTTAVIKFIVVVFKYFRSLGLHLPLKVIKPSNV
jgi:hypothetical protein